MALGQTLKRGSVLWLVAAMALVLAPHVAHQPPWVSGFVAAVWTWRAWLTWRGLSRPPKLVVLGLAACGVAFTVIAYGTLLGRDAGVVLLQFMLVLKLLEMRSLRDAMVAVFLSFFVVLTNFLDSQTMLMGAYMFGVIWLLIMVLIALHRCDEPSPSQLARSAAAMILQAVPLMLVFFLLFPRLPGPLWGMPKDTSHGVSGLSDEMSPGSLGSLAPSDAIAFRVEFTGPMPPSRALYWRTVVMDDFDGRTWRVARTFAPTAPVQGIGVPLDYAVTIEPHQRRWIFALDLPARVPPGARLDANYQLLAAQAITTRARYELSSHLSYRAGLDASAQELNKDLRLPPGNPRALALAQSFKAPGDAAGDVASRDTTARNIVRRALDYFRAGSFVYTLTPPVFGQDPVDGFIFGSKAGFCEHYAGAFTLLMRAAGIPARVVTGYQGGEVNDFGNYLIVRQAEAHAWSEVWLRGEGWVRVDPTAAVSPARIDEGIHAVSPAADLLPGLISAQRLEWLRPFRLSWDAVNNQWNQWVLGYDFERQKRLLARLGRNELSWQDLTITLMIASAGVVLGLAAWLLLWRTRQKSDPAVILYKKFCSRLARLGVQRQPFEGPLDFSWRAMAAMPEMAAEIAAITGQYMALRYADETITTDKLRRLVRGFPNG